MMMTPSPAVLYTLNVPRILTPPLCALKKVKWSTKVMHYTQYSYRIVAIFKKKEKSLTFVDSAWSFV